MAAGHWGIARDMQSHNQDIATWSMLLLSAPLIPHIQRVAPAYVHLTNFREGVELKYENIKCV